MKDNDDPKKIFERLKVVEVRFITPNHKIKEEDQMAVMLSQFPREHQAMITAEHCAKGAAVTTEDLEDAMNQHYRLINNGKTNQDEDEISLTAFDRTCCNCDKPGHRHKDCRARKKTSKFKRK